MLSNQSSSSSSVTFLDILGCSDATFFPSNADGFAGSKKNKSNVNNFTLVPEPRVNASLGFDPCWKSAKV